MYTPPCLGYTPLFTGERRKYCTFLGQSTAKPLSPLSARTVISSRLSSRPLVRHHRHLLSVMSVIAAPLLSAAAIPSAAAINATCYSTVKLCHLSAGHCHRIIASHLPPPSPLAHNAPLVCRQSHRPLSSAIGRTTSSLRFIASCLLLSLSLIHHCRC